ncbi:G-protein coupled receptor dmsr-1-like [Gigantopelta aegis]|uniref:G-protein coupled receptor dmsr-1-like n=1 Tax=Gigantopelta aegis TaxID=1735272 RepID=UPI001B88E45E|nr:G-protein coupled receptor dmsr-1-like [Gigantopelta aegis]
MENNHSTNFVIEMTSVFESTTTSPPTGIEEFGIIYGKIHGHLSIFVCIFGIISNVLNIIVLTRKHMLSPTNFILTALAIADMLTMTTYPIMAIYINILTGPDCINKHHPREWMYFILFHNLFIVTCHNIAMWLTVSLAVFRYIFVCMPTRAMTLCTSDRAKLTVAIVVVGTIIICTPNYVMYQVVDYNANTNLTYCYIIADSNFALDHPQYTQFTKWLYGVVIKILPCILLTFLSALLISAMQQARRRRVRLLSSSNRASGHDHQSSEHNRTTMMLVMVVLFFVITELPQGIVALIGGISDHFWNNVYVHLGDFMDILVLVNSAVNFILYCIMSQQFRSAFRNLFVGKNMPSLMKKNTKENGTPTYSVVKTEVTQL